MLQINYEMNKNVDNLKILTECYLLTLCEDN